jgi:hypothetical protein
MLAVMTLRVSLASRSNPVAPTIFRKNPFGENVGGLSLCGDESCVASKAVQTDRLQDFIP